MGRARDKSSGLVRAFCDQGFKVAFAAACTGLGIAREVVSRIASSRFEVLPRRWVVERTWSWLMSNRRLQVDYERDPIVSRGLCLGSAQTTAPAPPDELMAQVNALGEHARQPLSIPTIDDQQHHLLYPYVID